VSELEPYGQKLESFEFHPDRPEQFVADLGIELPPFADQDALGQLRYLAYYVSDPVINCKSILVERHYIDRDYMEDHSVFYSRNLYPYKNYCRRVHFFSIDKAEVDTRIAALRAIPAAKGLEEYRTASRQFSEAHYIGFSVIKPLDGSPVGRTVLRTFPAEKKGMPDYRRVFECERYFPAHLGGLTLHVRGLPFQQQDKAVAACATTALWSSLHAAREFEDIAAFTPAQITALAARNSLPFGRAMPSEGLSVDQMCQAVEAVGISPVLRRAENFANAKALLHSAIRSSVAPVLVLTNGPDWHAVAVTGMGVRDKPISVVEEVGDLASRLEKLYLHDDRIGPYLRAEIKEVGISDVLSRFQMEVSEPALVLEVEFRKGAGFSKESWLLTHILFPMHVKVRITFSELRQLAMHFVAAEIKAYRNTLGQKALSSAEASRPAMELEAWISRSPVYQESLMASRPRATDPLVATALANDVSLPRYVGIVRFEADYYDRMDLLIDTTSTDRNVHALALLVHERRKVYTSGLAKHLARHFRCRLFMP
jgi:hypothetical protein